MAHIPSNGELKRKIKILILEPHFSNVLLKKESF